MVTVVMVIEVMDIGDIDITEVTEEVHGSIRIKIRGIMTMAEGVVIEVNPTEVTHVVTEVTEVVISKHKITTNKVKIPIIIIIKIGILTIETRLKQLLIIREEIIIIIIIDRPIIMM